MKINKKTRYAADGQEKTKLSFKNSQERKFVNSSLSHIVEKIKELRKEKEISQEKLAELANISVGTIKFIEQNQRTPSLFMLLKIIYVLDPEAKIWE
jgi:DNA-binding XRE family transcriptional regulator